MPASVDPRTPVIVGAGQLSRRPSSFDDSVEPADMMAEALRLAQDDSKATASLLERADSVRTIGVLSWRYADPAGEVARRVGASNVRDLAVTATGGNGPQWLLNRTAGEIARGDLDVCLIAGAEAMYTRLRARSAGAHLDWTPLADGATSPARLLGDEKRGSNDAEGAVGLLAPPVVYPLFENALRAANGETIDEHQRVIAGLWSRFSEVAATNPHAWLPVAKTPDEIGTPSPDNRMVSFPYTKLLNANMQVDQSAALILCSYDAARAAGVPDDRMVFPVSGADANDHWYVSNRWDLHSSPAIAAAGRAALGAIGTTGGGIDDVAFVDLYSCFPAAVQIGARALGLPLDDPSRPLTLTGGLTFAGGPGNNYVTHSIATLVERLRSAPSSTLGLVTGLGWYVTKHSVGVYSSSPPGAGRSFVTIDAQPQVDALPRRELTADAEGPVVVETYTVTYDRDGTPANGIAACLLPDGSRTWATTTEPYDLDAMTTSPFIGHHAVVDDGRLLTHLD
jgi:acetyl-CoA C-acetyltransferase